MKVTGRIVGYGDVVKRMILDDEQKRDTSKVEFKIVAVPRPKWLIFSF